MSVTGAQTIPVTPKEVSTAALWELPVMGIRPIIIIIIIIITTTTTTRVILIQPVQIARWRPTYVTGAPLMSSVTPLEVFTDVHMGLIAIRMIDVSDHIRNMSIRLGFTALGPYPLS